MGSCYKKHRYTIGIAIGVVYALASSVIFILSAVSYYSRDDTNKDFVLMGAELGVFFPSVLFIFGILKKRPLFIYPWIILNMILFTVSCCILYTTFLVLSFMGGTNDQFFATLTLGVCVIAIEIGIFLFSYRLCGDIEEYNEEQSSNVVVSYHNGTKTYVAISHQPLI